MARFCTSCGKPVAEGALFCGACGAAVEAPQEATQPTPVIAEAPLTEQVPVEAVQTPEAEPEVPAQEVPVQEEPAPEEAPVQEEASREEPVQQVPMQQQQMQYQPAPPAEPAPKKEKKASGKRGGGIICLSVLLCIFLFIFATAFVLLLGLRASTSEESGTALVKEMVSSVDIREIPAANVVADKNYEGSVADWIVEKAKAESNGKEQFDERDFEKYVEESKMMQEISEHFGSLVWNIREGEDGDELTTKDIRKLLENDRKTIKKHLNFNITDKDIDKVIAEVEKSKVLEYTSSDFIRENAGGVYYAVQYTLSPLTLVVVIGLLLLSVLLICLVNRWRILPIFNDVGVTFLVFGIIFGGATFFMMWMSDLLFSGLGNFAFIGSGIAGAMTSFMIPSVIILVVGIGLLIAKKFIKKAQAKKVAC